MTLESTLKPFRFLQLEEGGASFFFMADCFYHDPLMRVITSRTAVSVEYFNGYQWAKLVSTMIERDFPAMCDAFQMDPEAEMFAMSSKDSALLEQVALHFRAILADEVQLRLLLDNLLA